MWAQLHYFNQWLVLLDLDLSGEVEAVLSGEIVYCSHLCTRVSFLVSPQLESQGKTTDDTSVYKKPERVCQMRKSSNLICPIPDTNVDSLSLSWTRFHPWPLSWSMMVLICGTYHKLGSIPDSHPESDSI